MISQFKSNGDDFFTNVPLPPDFAIMWTQALQQGFKPKLATVAKVLLFPTDAYAMGNKVYNIATDAWWVPSLPWHSSLTGDTCPQLAGAFTAAGLGQPNQNISNYTLFEIAYAASKWSTTPTTRKPSPPPSSRSSCPTPSPARSTTPLPTPRPTPLPAPRSPCPSASNGRRAPSTRSRPKSSTTPWCRTGQITGDLLPTNA